MKIVGLVALALALFVGGYVLGSYFPVSGLLSGQKSIKGDSELKVTVLDYANQPVSNLEVDVANENEPPTADGVRKTDANGIATFNLKPGHYYVFFNTINFPQNFQVPRETEIDVTEGQTNSKTIILQNAGR